MAAFDSDAFWTDAFDSDAFDIGGSGGAGSADPPSGSTRFLYGFRIIIFFLLLSF